LQKSRVSGRARTLGAFVAATLTVASLSLAVRWRKDPYRWGSHEKTIQSLIGMLKERPCAPDKLRWLVWELRAAGDDGRAAAYLDQVLDHCKLPADVHHLAYELHIERRDFEAATRDASRLILIDESDRQAHLDRAFAYLASQKSELAMQDDIAAAKLAKR
jgi:Flp pilus assembly protein TadD